MKKSAGSDKKIKFRGILSFIFSRLYFWMIIGLLLILFFGAWFMVRFALQTKNNLQAELLTTTNVINASLDYQGFENFTDTAADNTNPDYLRLRRQLLKVGLEIKNSNFRWTYTMRIKDNQVIFSVDSIPVTDPQYSPPGDTYQNPPAEIFKAAAQGQTYFSAPYSDEWGRWISVFAPIRNEDGRVIGVIGTDISYDFYQQEILQSLFFPSAVTIALSLIYLIIFLYTIRRNRFLRIIQKQKAKDEAMLSSLGEGIIACDKNGVITLANKAAEDMLKISAAAALGESFYQVCRLTDENGVVIPEEKLGLFGALKNKKIITIGRDFKAYYIRQDGSRFPVIATVAPIFVGKEITGAIAIFQDISYEQAIDRMKTEFISLVSHQLRTPLTSIKYFSEMLNDEAKKKLSKPQEGYLSSIIEVNGNMIALVNALLDISRIESGRLTIEPQPTDLGELAGQVINEIGHEAKEKKQKLTIFIPKNLPKINVDPHLISEVIKNLLTNSIKYTPPKGRIAMSFSLKGKEIDFQITDNGYGIPKADQSKVFTKFYRAENISRLTEGSGLGLYLIKMIIEASGGKIWFISDENVGTTFWFSLPLAGSPVKAGEVSLS